MGAADELRRLYGDYLQQVETLLAQAKPGDGLLGMGKAPQQDDCHEQFDRRVEELVQAHATLMDPAEATEMTGLLLRGEKETAAPACASWMLIAVQRHSMALFPRIPEEDARLLLSWYTEAYPVFHRLPIQKEIIRLLKRRAR